MKWIGQTIGGDLGDACVRSSEDGMWVYIFSYHISSILYFRHASIMGRATPTPMMALKRSVEPGVP